MELSDDQLRTFDRLGYLTVEGVIDPAAWLDPLAHEYEEVLDRLAVELWTAGRIMSTHADLEFGPRFTQIAFEVNETLAQHFDCSLPQGGIRPDTPMWFGPAVFRAITNPALLDVVESVIGGEIYSNPVQHIRIKPPEPRAARDEEGRVKLGATTWHQDNGVVLPAADGTEILTVWFALSDADEEHGCLQVVPGSHRRGLLDHCLTPGGLEVPLAVTGRAGAVPLPTRRGDVILLHRHALHSSLPNVSGEIRWSLDLRYNPIGQPTGRDAFPGFVARSRRDPADELQDPDEWARRWRSARDELAASSYAEPFHRWDAAAAVCA